MVGECGAEVQSWAELLRAQTLLYAEAENP